jgi:hypothetical protein
LVYKLRRLLAHSKYAAGSTPFAEIRGSLNVGGINLLFDLSLCNAPQTSADCGNAALSATILAKGKVLCSWMMDSRG